VFEKLVEERIKEAQQRGDFKALHGAGKPLPVDDAGMVPEEFRLAVPGIEKRRLQPSAIACA